MIIYILKKLFKTVIGNLSEEQKRQLWARFNVLLMDIVKAGAEGIAKGAVSPK